MMAHPEEARSYSRLKEELTKKFSDDIEGYMDGKDKFIKEIDQRGKAYWRDRDGVISPIQPCTTLRSAGT